jgi:OmpA-OmpF porin, OOP family
MKRLYWFILSLCAITSSAQIADTNLVGNSSFESYKVLPDNVGDGKICIQDWTFACVRGGGDYYHTDAKNKNANTAANYFGQQEPHSGKAYAGFCTTWEYREFLQIQLKQPLQKGKKYRFRMYISCGDKIWLAKMKEIGVLFTKNAVIIPEGKPMFEPPQLLFYNANGFSEAENWIELSSEYTADGTEYFMTIGCFEWASEKSILTNGIERRTNPPITGTVKDSHYFIDDVSLSEIKSIASSADSVSHDSLSFHSGAVLNLTHLMFETGKSKIKSTDFSELDKVVIYMNQNPDARISIEGHTDNKGKDEKNNQLSLDRANAVKSYLVKQGIASDRIETKGYGSAKPILPNATAEGRAKNRRVEVRFL